MNYTRKLCESIDADPLPPLLFFHSLLLHGTINVSDTEMETITIKRVTEAELADDDFGEEGFYIF